MFWGKSVVGLSLAVCSLNAAVERQIDEKNPIAITFSRISHNRIAVDGGAVEKVIGDASIFSVTLDKSTGQAFINVLQDVQRPLTLTVVTNAGFVQDLLVSAKDCPSEQVILREEDESDWDGVVVNPEIVQGAAVVEMLNRILEGKVPFGYGQKPIENEEALELPKPLSGEIFKVLEGALETIVVYRIKNEGPLTLVVTSDSLKKENHSWVFLNAQNLGPKQEALCIIAYPKDGN